MKKYFLFVVLALSAIAAQAQCTWNVRGGFGMRSDYVYDYYYYHFSYDNTTYEFYDYYNGETVSGGALAIQCNIPIGKSHRHTFSPTAFSTLGEYSSVFGLLQYGYKIGSGLKSIFYPKIGLALGGGSKVGFVVGGSVELAYEYKHFIVAVNYIPAYTHETETEGCFHAFGITAGYKF